jgi:hypothetical protein
MPDYTLLLLLLLVHRYVSGGYAILKGIQKGMLLSADKMMPDQTLVTAAVVAAAGAGACNTFDTQVATPS